MRTHFATVVSAASGGDAYAAPIIGRGTGR